MRCNPVYKILMVLFKTKWLHQKILGLDHLESRKKEIYGATSGLQGWTLVLFKSMLESILVYRVSLSFITKGVLEHVRKLRFKFLWAGTLEERVFLGPLIEILLYQNTWEGGTSIISTAKCAWKCIQERGLWVNTI